MIATWTLSQLRALSVPVGPLLDRVEAMLLEALTAADDACDGLGVDALHSVLDRLDCVSSELLTITGAYERGAGDGFTAEAQAQLETHKCEAIMAARQAVASLPPSTVRVDALSLLGLAEDVQGALVMLFDEVTVVGARA